MPRVGRRALDAIPVLNLSEGISTMAAPVVSEPVPAVVGTKKQRAEDKEQRSAEQAEEGEEEDRDALAMRGRRVRVTGRPLPTGALMKSRRGESR